MLPSTKPPPSPPRPSVRPEYVHILSSPPPPFFAKVSFVPFLSFLGAFSLTLFPDEGNQNGARRRKEESNKEEEAGGKEEQS